VNSKVIQLETEARQLIIRRVQQAIGAAGIGIEVWLSGDDLCRKYGDRSGRKARKESAGTTAAFPYELVDVKPGATGHDNSGDTLCQSF